MYEVRRSPRLSRKKRINYNYNRHYDRKKPYQRRIEKREEHDQKEIQKKPYFYCEKCNTTKNVDYCQECDNRLYYKEDFDTDDYTIDSNLSE